MNKKILTGMVAVSVLMLTISSCKDNKRVAAETETQTTAAQVTAIETKAEAMAETSEAPITKTEQADDEGFPSTYERPEGKVLELLKDYNAHMDDYNTSGVTALGMGFQQNRVLLNYTADNYLYDLKDKVKLKAQASELIKALPGAKKAAWRCIPDEGHDLMMTFVGKQSNEIVSVIFTCKELKALL